jgi:hypothetical protein
MVQTKQFSNNSASLEDNNNNKKLLSLRGLHRELCQRYGKISLWSLHRRVKDGLIVPNYIRTYNGKVTKYCFHKDAVDAIASLIYIQPNIQPKKELNQEKPENFDFIKYFENLSKQNETKKKDDQKFDYVEYLNKLQAEIK